MKRRTVFAALVGLSLLAALFVGSALAVHDEGIFELDVVNGQAAANTWDDPSVPGEDWADVYAKSLDASKPLNAFAFAFITDGVGQQEASFFTGGGSKDVNDIPDWLYATVNDVVPDKDDIEHAFAAAYEKAEADGTHTIFYFGGDRFDAGDGSAQLGFWFFRQPVTLNPLVPPATTWTFNGVHQVGDILVLADFVKGGAAAKERMKPMFLAETPLGRGTSVEDIANMVAFLASDVSADIVGQVISVDGGSTFS